VDYTSLLATGPHYTGSDVDMFRHQVMLTW
jgi:hypothetical protein